MDVASTSPRPAFAGRYELLRELGRGGMATVYLARDARHDRDVAIKIMRPDFFPATGLKRTGIPTEMSYRFPIVGE